MSEDDEITPERMVRDQLEASIHEWSQHHYGQEFDVVEYVVVVKGYKPGMESNPARFLYGWRRNPDSDALLGMLARVKRYLLRTQDAPQRSS